LSDHLRVETVITRQIREEGLMETQNQIELRVPPQGKVEAQVTGPTPMIRWAPGNGVVYQLLVTPVSDEIGKWTGGSVLLSILRRHGAGYATYPGNPSGLYHLNFVEEKWGKDLGEEGTFYVTALLNWTLFGDDIANQYAKEIFEGAKRKWAW
jgi:hypothetical protein